MTFTTRYMGAACAYGASRKINKFVTNPSYCTRRTWEDKRAPMLGTTKVVIVAMSGFVGCCMLPAWLYKDVCQLEMNLRALPENERYIWDDPKTILDYVYD